jgi:tetratricopeptide (TPR) repeat protein
MLRFDTIPLLLAGTLSLSIVCGAQPQAPAPCQLSGSAASQANGANDPSSNKAKEKVGSTSQAVGVPCPAVVNEPSAAQKFPFPGSSSAPSLPSSSASAPDTPTAHKPSAAEEHPFPGSAPPMPDSDAENSSSSSSNDGSSSASDGAAPDPPTNPDKSGTPGTLGRRRLPKVEKLQTDEDRVEEDLKVAKFYEGKGDLNAAYLRVRDAVKSLPTDSESHFELARIAQKLNKRDEAIAEYNSYLKMEPDGLNIKEAHKALVQLQSK